MRKIAYKDYFDKVYGCMIGKCVSGTAGAPYEGMKQHLNLHFTAEEADTTLPNDDLDLQVLWLEVLEKKGICVTSDDLAEIFLERCPYCPGEYAVFKKNYRRHIHPPRSEVITILIIWKEWDALSEARSGHVSHRETPALHQIWPKWMECLTTERIPYGENVFSQH